MIRECPPPDVRTDPVPEAVEMKTQDASDKDPKFPLHPKPMGELAGFFARFLATRE